MKKMVMIGVGVAVLLAAAIGGTLFVTGAFGGHAAASATEAAPAPVKSAAAYLPMDPAFTVNIEDGFATRFLQVEINLMYRDSSVVDRATKAMPHIRNDVLLLLSAQNRESIGTPEGRVALQAALLNKINEVLTADTGAGGIEAVYFTKLVVQ